MANIFTINVFSCYYFETFSTFLHWVVERGIANAGLLHYLDHFLFISGPDSSACLYALQKFQDISSFFSIPLANEKTVLPYTQIHFPGITIDSNLMQFSFTVK